MPKRREFPKAVKVAARNWPRRRGSGVNLAGQRFAMWVVLSEADRSSGQRCWACRCDCGKEAIVRQCHLRSGASQSCGCGAAKRRGDARRTHGKSDHPLYVVWLGMIQRCENTNHKSYPLYGGKGIRVCAQWRRDFAAFFRDMGDRPSSAHSIERKDGSRGYEPENCVWATPKQQARNMSRNALYTINDETKSLAEWVEERDKIYGTVKWRIREKGMSIEDALR